LTQQNSQETTRRDAKLIKVLISAVLAQVVASSITIFIKMCIIKPIKRQG